MAYIKYKELTKYFDFSKHIKTGDLPWYIYDYVYDDEEILVSYKLLEIMEFLLLIK